MNDLLAKLRFADSTVNVCQMLNPFQNPFGNLDLSCGSTKKKYLQCIGLFFLLPSNFVTNS